MNGLIIQWILSLSHSISLSLSLSSPQSEWQQLKSKSLLNSLSIFSFSTPLSLYIYITVDFPQSVQALICKCLIPHVLRLFSSSPVHLTFDPICFSVTRTNTRAALSFSRSDFTSQDVSVKRHKVPQMKVAGLNRSVLTRCLSVCQ